MTMDFNSRSSTSVTTSSKPSPPLALNYPPSYPASLPPRNIKRSFDVAFLVAPDEKLARKQQEKLRLVATGSLLKRVSPPPPPHNLLYQQHEARRPRRAGDERSAFTKVTSSRLESPRSVCSLSPDHLHYQDSMSPHNSSPLPHYHNGGDFQNANNNPPSQTLVTQSVVVSAPSKGINTYSSEYLQASVKHIKNVNFSGNIPVSMAENYKNAIAASGNFRNNIDSYLLRAGNQYIGHDKDMMSTSSFGGANKIRANMLYPHPDSVAYSTLASAYPFAASFPPPSSAELLRPPSLPSVAAVVSASLLPSTFAAFSLPAQNICAKCNISFRMTSDLVYHMRSHHKGDSLVADPLKRRRDQDKLKCPVCSESFRERHHLTRHMTAHQDKDGDYEEVGEGVGGRRGRVGAGGK